MTPDDDRFVAILKTDWHAFQKDLAEAQRERDEAREERDYRDVQLADAAEVGRRLIRERDEERAKVEALLLGDKALQPRIWLGEEVQRLRAEIEQWKANFGASALADATKLHAALAEAQRREELMRPVVEAAKAWRHWPVAGWRLAENGGKALIAAVDTYETQTGGTE